MKRAFGIAVIALASAAPAAACRANFPPETRIAYSYQRGLVKGVALAKVLHAAYTAKQALERRPWSGEVEVIQVVRGRVAARRTTISRTGSSAACDDGIGPPAHGELWILYFARNHQGEYTQHTYPLAIARRADSRLARLKEKRAGR